VRSRILSILKILIIREFLRIQKFQLPADLTKRSVNFWSTLLMFTIRSIYTIVELNRYATIWGGLYRGVVCLSVTTHNNVLRNTAETIEMPIVVGRKRISKNSNNCKKIGQTSWIFTNFTTGGYTNSQYNEEALTTRTDRTSLRALRRSSHSFHSYEATMLDSWKWVSVCVPLSLFMTGFSIILPESFVCTDNTGDRDNVAKPTRY